MINRSKQKAALYCSFCGKSSQQVTALVAGPHVYICDECISLCITYLPFRSRLNAFATMFFAVEVASSKRQIPYRHSILGQKSPQWRRFFL